MMKLARVALVCVAVVFAAGQVHAQDDRFARFGEHDPESERTIDFTIWSEMLDAITYDVGMSDRYLPIGRIVETGSRVTGQPTSRYRTEGNRVIFHLLEDVHRESISAYRADLTALPRQVSLSSLNKSEQLAYWLNLHNVIVIDEIAQRYPVRNIDRIRLEDGEDLHEGVVATIEGVDLSLSDIRNNIVTRHWDDPLVIYGFFYGSIGGPSLQARAYTGGNLRNVLSRNAREYVNALRGVENSTGTVRVSQIYFDAQALFPQWPADLLTHLNRFADDDVAEILESADRIAPIRFEWDVADMTHGGGRCGGGIRRNIESNAATRGAEGASANLAACDPLPPIARDLTVEVQQRRLRAIRSGDFGRVTITDIATEDEDHSRSGGASGRLVERDEQEGS